MTSPKGLCAIIDKNNAVRFYGYQKPEVVSRFCDALVAKGIRLDFNG